MKRGGTERDMGSPQKRARNLGFELRILIPSRVAGSIIGKGGSNITRLRSETKTMNISVHGYTVEHLYPKFKACLTKYTKLQWLNDVLISVSSDEQDITLGVLGQIVPMIEEASKGRDGGDGTVEVRLLFHHTQVGCIIGKGGAKIKELRETTATQIKVYGSCCPRSTDRVVAISGNIDTVLNAIKQIVLLVNENPIKGPNDPYDPHNFDDVFAIQYGGFGEPRGGYDGPGRGGFRGGGGGRMMGGPRGGGGGFRGNDAPRGGGRGGFRDGGGRGGMGVGSNGGRHEEYGGPSEGDFGDEERTTTQVTIPKEYAGAIIGKGGSRIRRIRAESGANITIDEALPGSSDRIITISGANGQIRMAQYLLQQSVKDHGDRKF